MNEYLAAWQSACIRLKQYILHEPTRKKITMEPNNSS